MAYEKSWETVFPTPLTADGTAQGLIQIADTLGFYVKGVAQLSDNTGLKMVVQINQVLSSTQMIVGRPGSSPSATAGGNASGAVVDVSAFKVINGATIGFAMQPKNKIKPDDIEQATYAGDPVTAVRVIPVDPYGNLIGPDNPLAVAIDGTITLGDVSIVDPITHIGANVTPVGGVNALDVNIAGGNVTVGGTVNVNLNGLDAFQTSQYTVGTSAIQITPTPLVGRSSVGVKAICPGSNVIYVGNSSSVTISDGYPLFNGDALQMDLTDSDTIWAISATTGNTLCALEIGV